MNGETDSAGTVLMRGLKTLLVALLIGPLVAALVFMCTLLVISGDFSGWNNAAGTHNLLGIFQLILVAAYGLIVPHLLFCGLVGWVVYRLRERVNVMAFWQQAQWVLLIYVCTMTITVNGEGIRIPHRLMFLFSLFVAAAFVWFLTRRWHSPVPARR